jgi:hypothetical protein
MKELEEQKKGSKKKRKEKKKGKLQIFIIHQTTIQRSK